MLTTINEWRNTARVRLSSPLTKDDKERALQTLMQAAPVVIDDTVLGLVQIMQHEWHIDGTNQCGYRVPYSWTFAGPGPTMERQALIEAVSWAEKQSASPDCRWSDPCCDHECPASEIGYLVVRRVDVAVQNILATVGVTPHSSDLTSEIESGIRSTPHTNTTQQRGPDTYFSVQANGPWAEIKSLGVAGGKGDVSVHESHLGEFFQCARTAHIDNYERWLLDPYPVGGSVMLMRMSGVYNEHEDRFSAADEDEDGMLFIDPDTHPSSGRLFFGEPSQEREQLSALARLEESIVELLSAAAPKEEDKQAARERAAKIAATAAMSFMPSSGFCTWCDADVTHALAGIKPGASITGCPVCGHTWCD